MLYWRLTSERFSQNAVTNIREIATLGPTGTSSELAAASLAERLRTVGVKTSLFDEYEAAADHVLATTGAVLVVANAYHAINNFYISRVLEPIAAFFCDTPAYVIATADEARMSETIDELRIASHSAPSHLIGDVIPGRSIRLIEVSSTSAAAKLAASGTVDACLTTATAAKLNGLSVLSTAFDSIPMLWSVFMRRGGQ